MHDGQQVLVAPEEVDHHKRKQSKREDESRKQKARLEAGMTADKADIQAGSTFFFEEGVGRCVCKMHLRSMAGDGSTRGALLMCRLLWMLLRPTG